MILDGQCSRLAELRASQAPAAQVGPGSRTSPQQQGGFVKVTDERQRQEEEEERKVCRAHGTAAAAWVCGAAWQGFRLALVAEHSTRTTSTSSVGLAGFPAAQSCSLLRGRV